MFRHTLDDESLYLNRLLADNISATADRLYDLARVERAGVVVGGDAKAHPELREWIARPELAWAALAPAIRAEAVDWAGLRGRADDKLAYAVSWGLLESVVLELLARGCERDRLFVEELLARADAGTLECPACGEACLNGQYYRADEADGEHDLFDCCQCDTEWERAELADALRHNLGTRVRSITPSVPVEQAC